MARMKLEAPRKKFTTSANPELIGKVKELYGGDISDFLDEAMRSFLEKRGYRIRRGKIEK